MTEIDLNSDLAESFGVWRLSDDEAVLDAVTSANVACGYHAGDPSTLRRTCVAAVARGVAIGAQVGYPDLIGFGRRFLDIAPDELTDAVVYQVGALDALARAAGGRVTYVKPHGALYNAVVHHEAQAGAVVRAVVEVGGLPLLGLPGSLLLDLASEAGVPTIAEGFADRAYTPAGTLVPRSEPDALVRDVDEVARRAVRMVTAGEIEAIDGTIVAVEVGSVCVHGDTPEAVAMAHAVRTALEDAGVSLASFAP